MPKAKIITTTRLDQRGLEEIHELMDIDIVVEERNVVFKTKFNIYFQTMYLDFDWMRSLFTEKDVDIRALYTTRKELDKAGVDKGHLALYDLSDNDGVLDFYVGLQPRLDKRAKANGFRTNLAWEFVHEMLHGLEQRENIRDRTHTMEEQGRLKELLNEHLIQIPELKKKKIFLLETIIGLLKRLQGNSVPTQLIHPVEAYQELISQTYGTPNKAWYPVTGRHIGTDYACPVGTNVLAPFDGTVLSSGYSPSLGNFCQYEYTYKGVRYVSRFMHLSGVPDLGKYRQGEVLAKSGVSGDTTGPHLHVDIWRDEVRLDLITKDNWNKLTVDPVEHYKN